MALHLTSITCDRQPVSLSGVYARVSKACADAGSQTAFARKHGLTPAIVNDVLHTRRDPNAALLAAVGLRRVLVFLPMPGKT